jgi:hypothetical protein
MVFLEMPRRLAISLMGTWPRMCQRRIMPRTHFINIRECERPAGVAGLGATTRHIWFTFYVSLCFCQVAQKMRSSTI